MKKPPSATPLQWAVLLIDTESDVSRNAVTALTQAKLHVDHVTDARAGLQTLNLRPPHLVLIGAGLPQNSKGGLCSAVRQKSRLPIAVLSAVYREADHLEALNMGADDFIVLHPFNAQMLTVRVLSLLRRVYSYCQMQPSQLVNAAPVAPTPSAPAAPVRSGEAWVTCELCSYMGPQARFAKHNAQGMPVMICPNCNEPQNLRFSL
ncbi:MAG: two-component system, OmpR family, response regulator ChvI [Abditibacteriota bacterium]|nr:two-component system, OmpR family, response regulator ChvI [Abditibacteriota bacterium]